MQVQWNGVGQVYIGVSNFSTINRIISWDFWILCFKQINEKWSTNAVMESPILNEIADALNTTIGHVLKKKNNNVWDCLIHRSSFVSV